MNRNKLNLTRRGSKTEKIPELPIKETRATLSVIFLLSPDTERAAATAN